MSGAKLRLFIWTTAPLLILLIPLLAMQLTREVQWTGGDFMLAGGGLALAGGSYALATRRHRKTVQRIVIAVSILAILALVWIEAAVGIFT